MKSRQGLEAPLKPQTVEVNDKVDNEISIRRRSSRKRCQLLDGPREDNHGARKRIRYEKKDEFYFAPLNERNPKENVIARDLNVAEFHPESNINVITDLSQINPDHSGSINNEQTDWDRCISSFAVFDLAKHQNFNFNKTLQENSNTLTNILVPEVEAIQKHQNPFDLNLGSRNNVEIVGNLGGIYDKQNSAAVKTHQSVLQTSSSANVGRQQITKSPLHIHRERDAVTKCDLCRVPIGCHWSQFEKHHYKCYHGGCKPKLSQLFCECEYDDCNFRSCCEILLKYHVHFQHDKDCYRCDECNFKCSSTSNLEAHKKETHWSTSLCDMIVSHWFQFKKDHCDRYHGGFLPEILKCKYHNCVFKCCCQKLLGYHINFKHDKLYYPCDYCSFKCNYTTCVKEHIEKHWNTDLCEICGSKVSRGSSKICIQCNKSNREKKPNASTNIDRHESLTESGFANTKPCSSLNCSKINLSDKLPLVKLSKALPKTFIANNISKPRSFLHNLKTHTTEIMFKNSGKGKNKSNSTNNKFKLLEKSTSQMNGSLMLVNSEYKDTSQNNTNTATKPFLSVEKDIQKSPDQVNLNPQSQDNAGSVKHVKRLYDLTNQNNLTLQKSTATTKCSNNVTKCYLGIFCELCGRRFRFSSFSWPMFEQHHIACYHIGSKPGRKPTLNELVFKCESKTCKLAFCCQSLLTYHQCIAHNRKYECIYCDFLAKTIDVFTDHISKHENSGFCDMCDKNDYMTDSFWSYKICTGCKIIFNTKKDLKTLIEAKRNDVSKSNLSKNNMKTDDNKDLLVNNSYPCENIEVVLNSKLTKNNQNYDKLITQSHHNKPDNALKNNEEYTHGIEFESSDIIKNEPMYEIFNEDDLEEVITQDLSSQHNTVTDVNEVLQLSITSATNDHKESDGLKQDEEFFVFKHGLRSHENKILKTLLIKDNPDIYESTAKKDTESVNHTDNRLITNINQREEHLLHDIKFESSDLIKIESSYNIFAFGDSEQGTDKNLRSQNDVENRTAQDKIQEAQGVDTSFVCPYCGIKIFGDVFNFKAHLHCCQTGIICNLCELPLDSLKYVKWSSILGHHYFCVHGSNNCKSHYQCKWLECSFESCCETLLFQHHYINHTSEYQCKFCKFKAKQFFLFNTHLKKHTTINLGLWQTENSLTENATKSVNNQLVSCNIPGNEVVPASATNCSLLENNRQVSENIVNEMEKIAGENVVSNTIVNKVDKSWKDNTDKCSLNVAGLLGPTNNLCRFKIKYFFQDGKLNIVFNKNNEISGPILDVSSDLNKASVDKVSQKVVEIEDKKGAH